MKFDFRRDYLDDESQLKHIAEIDITIPVLFDSLFKADEKTLQERILFLKKTYHGQNYFEVALDTRQMLAGYHGIRIENLYGTKIGTIDTLWVAPTYRQLGLATELKERGEAWAREQKLDHIYTWVHANNKPMVEINKSMGYEIVHYKFKKKL